MGKGKKYLNLYRCLECGFSAYSSTLCRVLFADNSNFELLSGPSITSSVNKWSRKRPYQIAPIKGRSLAGQDTNITQASKDFTSILPCAGTLAHPSFVLNYTGICHGQQYHDTSGGNLESLYSVSIFTSAYCRPIPGYVLHVCRYTFSKFSQMSVNGRSYIVFVQAYIWDWLMSLPEEYTAFKKVGFRLPNMAYFASRSVIHSGDHLVNTHLSMTRFASLGFCISTTLFMGSCLPHISPVHQLTDHYSRSTTPLRSPSICTRHILRDCCTSHFVAIFFPRESRLQ